MRNTQGFPPDPIPWGKHHFKMAGLSLAPFSKDVELGF